MNPVLITGTIIVTGALVFYSIAVLTEQRQKVLTVFVLTTLTIGLTLDVTATVFMIVGSRHIPITIHGFLGYSALAGMLVDTLLVWQQWQKGLREQAVPRRLHGYTRLAYGWWVTAYLAGGIVAALTVR